MTVGYQARLQYNVAKLMTDYGSELNSLYNSYTSTGKFNVNSVKKSGSTEALNKLLDSKALKNKSDEYRTQFSDLYKSIYNISDDSSEESGIVSPQAVKTASANVGGSAEAIRSYANKFKYGKAEDFDIEEYKSYAQNFVDNYNAFIDKIGNSDNTTVLKKGVLAVNNAKIYSNALDRAGITLGSDNKLTLQSDLSKVDMIDVKSTFGRGGFSDTVIRRAREINEASGGMGIFTSQIIRKSDSAPTVSNGDALYKSSSALKTSASDIKSYSDAVKSGEKAYDSSEYAALANSFAEKYNALVGDASSSDNSTVKTAGSAVGSITKSYGFALEKAGFEIDDKGKLSFSESKISSVQDIENLFDSSYVKKISEKASAINSVTSGSASAEDKNGSLKELTSAVKEAATAVKSYSNSLGSDDVTYKAVDYTDTATSFIEKYNKLLDETDNSENQSVQYKGSALKSVTNSYKYALKRAGIEIGKNGRLSLSEQAAEKLTEKDLSYAFGGSYIDKVNQKADQISSLATSASAMGYTSNSTAAYAYNSGALYSVYA